MQSKEYLQFKPNYQTEIHIFLEMKNKIKSFHYYHQITGATISLEMHVVQINKAFGLHFWSHILPNLAIIENIPGFRRTGWTSINNYSSIYLDAKLQIR